MTQTKSQELSLEDYKLDISVYKSCGEKLSILEEKSNSLEKEKKLFEKGGNSLIFLFGLLYILIFSLFYTHGQGFWDSFWISFGVGIYTTMLVWGIFADFLINITSFGKFNKLKEQIKEVEKLKTNADSELKNARNKLKPFEKETCEYYQIQLENFLTNDLYKKRSGTQEFEEALQEFASMIEELATINSTFVTTSIPLWKYQEYLTKRTINHNFQTSKKSERLVSIHNFVKSFSEQKEQNPKESLPPEKAYRVVRKVYNWEEINKKRNLTGLKGEEIAVIMEQEYFESIGRKDLADKVRHVSKEVGDGSGYDILSFFADGREKYIEVKSTTNSITTPYYLSRNELKFLKEHHDDYWLYRILVSDDTPQFRAYSSLEVLEMNEIVPIQYVVSEIKSINEDK